VSTVDKPEVENDGPVTARGLHSKSQVASSAFFASFAARGSRAIGSIGALLIAARLFSISQVGQFAYLLAIGAIVSLIFDAGVTTYVAREVAARGFRTNRLERLALIFRIAGFPLAIASGWFLARLADSSIGVAAVGTLCFAATISFTDFLSTRQRAHGRFVAELVEIVPALWGPLIISATFGVYGASFAAFQVTLGASAICFLAFRVWQAFRELSPQEDEERFGNIRSLLWHSRWFLLSGIGGWALFESPNVILKALASHVAVALYAAALRPVGVVTHPFLVLGRMFIPSLSHDRLHDQEHFVASVRRMNLVSVALVPAGFAIAIIAGEVLLPLFGDQYVSAMPIVWILAVGSVVYMGPAKPAALIVVGAERELSVVSACGAMLLALIAVFLVPEHGAVGAAIAVLSALVGLKLAHLVLYRAHSLPGFTRGQFGIVVTTAVWIVVAWKLTVFWAVVVLAAGASVSMAATFLLLRGTRLFGAPIRNRSSDSESR